MNQHPLAAPAAAIEPCSVDPTLAQRAKALHVDKAFHRSVYADKQRYLWLDAAEIAAILNTRDTHFEDLRKRLQAVHESTERDRDIVALAHRRHHDEGALEIDASSTVSEGDDNGAYVQAWLWLPFEGTPLDKTEQCHECDGSADCSKAGRSPNGH
jgi:HrpA-like RNA helicase